MILRIGPSLIKYSLLCRHISTSGPRPVKRYYSFSSQTGKMLKVSSYRTYCIDFNQIWRNNRDHQVVFVGGSNRRSTNPRWRTAAIFKTIKLTYLCKRFTDFDEIWHDNAYCPLTADQPLRFRFFENPRWRWPPS